MGLEQDSVCLKCRWRPKRLDSVTRFLSCIAAVVVLVMLALLGAGEDRQQRRGLGRKSHLRKWPGGEAEDPASQTCFWVCRLGFVT